MLLNYGEIRAAIRCINKLCYSIVAKEGAAGTSEEDAFKELEKKIAYNNELN